MARRVQPVVLWSGLGAAALVAFLSFGTLATVALSAESVSALGQFDWAAVRFTVMQATLSAFLSVGFAIPVARALARRDFPFRGLLIVLLGAPFILPVIVAILGLTAVFGRSGFLSHVLDWAGFEPISIYGLHGILIAHVFFNLPLAVRLLLHGWGTIPAERFRLAAALRFNGWQTLRHVEGPMLRDIVPGALAVIFLICTTSFAVALTFGGGPKATTVELAIYEAFRYDFDLGKAALLSLIQFGICAIAAVASLRFQVPQVLSGALGRKVERFDPDTIARRLGDSFWILAATLFLLAPLVTLAFDGANGLLDLPTSVWTAAGRSLMVALGSTALTLGLALALSLAAIQWRWLEGIALTSIAASPLVMGTGLFILVFPFADPASLALPVTMVVNAIMALPFAVRIVAPSVSATERSFGQLADGLGVTGWARFRLVLLPRIRAPLGYAGGLSAALSMGDLGVIALFARPDDATLPLQIYRLMGSYRMEQAMGAALLLLALSLMLFYVFERGGRGRADD
ncbi:thiamine/thiamine pyrophosphate ABC transporter permease ThiP [Celeribacter sp.]|uniref:thiamine/thiamine pyrophosphate ABC transporter permease ThiP n=1 Tax=Celeribacter sp. TaxID=1890673 RepID=UPI003A8D64F1